MSKFVFNNLDNDILIRGIEIKSKDFFLIPSNLEVSWSNDSEVISKILSNELIISNDGITKISEPILGLKFFIGHSVETENSPFAKKLLPDGRKLYRRKHGVRAIVPANSSKDIVFEIPYVQCKIDEVEFINCSGEDTADLIINDSLDGNYTGTPEKKLNQFGFGVCLSEGYYNDSSNYDADLFIGMRILIRYSNNSSEARNVGANFVLHEVK